MRRLRWLLVVVLAGLVGTALYFGYLEWRAPVSPARSYFENQGSQISPTGWPIAIVRPKLGKLYQRDGGVYLSGWLRAGGMRLIKVSLFLGGQHEGQTVPLVPVINRAGQRVEPASFEELQGLLDGVRFGEVTYLVNRGAISAKPEEQALCQMVPRICQLAQIFPDTGDAAEKLTITEPIPPLLLKLNIL